MSLRLFQLPGVLFVESLEKDVWVVLSFFEHTVYRFYCCWRRAHFLDQVTSVNIREQSSNPIFANHNILTIFDLVIYLNVLIVHQAINNKLPFSVQSTFNFTKPSHEFNTRDISLGTLTKVGVNTSHFGIWSLEFQCIRYQNHFRNID